MIEAAGPNDDAPVLPQFCRGKGMVTVAIAAVGPVHANTTTANGAAAGDPAPQESPVQGSEIKKKSRRQRRQVLSRSHSVDQAQLST